MEKMIKILTAQLFLCEKLLELNEKYRKNLLDRTTGHSQDLIAQQEECMGKIMALESRKQAELKHAAAATLEEFSERKANRTDDRLQSLNERLRMTADRLKRWNHHNQELLQKNMAFIDFSINVLTNTMTDSTYAKQGNTSPHAVVSQKKMFDQKI